MTLTINTAPSITGVDDQTICSNSTASLGAVLGGSITTGVWTSSSGHPGFSPNANDRNAIYTPSNGDKASGTVTLTFTSTDATSPCSNVNDSMVLTIRDEILITTEPQNVGVCANNPANLSIIAVGDDLQYEWFHNGSSIGNNSNILNFPSAQVSNAGNYYVVVSSNHPDTPCASDTSNTVTLNVNEEIDIDVSSQPIDATRCVGGSYSFTVGTPSGTITSYQWYKVGSPDVALSNDATFSGVDTETLNIDIIIEANEGDYYVVITGPGGTCPSVSSLTGTLTVTEIPTATITYTTPFCSDDNNAATPTLTGTHDYTGGTYSSPDGLLVNSTTGAFTPSANAANNYSIEYTTLGNACSQITVSTSITITPLPTANINYTPDALCESDIATYGSNLIQTNGTTGSYSYITNTGGPTLILDTSTGVISPNGSDIGTYTITYTIPASNGCGVVSDTDTIIIEADPDATFSYASSDYCNVGIDPTPTITETGGTFSSSPAGLVIDTNTGIIDLDASTIGSYTITYTFGAVTNGCGLVETSQNISIAPDLGDALLDGFAWDQESPPVAGIISSQILACHQGDGTLTLHIDPSYIPYIVEWQYNTGSGFVTAPSDGDPDSNILTYDFTGLIGTTGYRVVFATGTSCGNAGYSSVAYVSVIPPDLKPEPVSASQTEFCYGDFTTLTASTNYGAEQLTQEGGFDQGQLNTNDPDGWMVDGELGKLSASANSENPNNWSVTNDQKTFHGIVYDNDIVSPPSNEGKFGIANGYYNVTGVGGHPVIYDPITGYRITTLETPIFSLISLQDATLDFREAYSLSGPQASCYTDESHTTTEAAPAAEAIIEISLDGGVTYTEFLRPTITGTNPAPYTNSGAGSFQDFNDVSLDLSAYFGQTDVRIKFTFVRNCTSTWAIDGISLPGGNPGSTIEWTDQFDVFISNENTVNWAPITPGYQIYTVTTFINGCRSLAPEGSEDVPLTVDMAYAGVDQSISGGCGSSAFLHAYDNSKTAYINFNELSASGNWVDGIYTVPPSVEFDYAGTGAIGEWSIVSGPAIVGIPDWTAEDPANYFFPNINDPRAEFAGPGGTYVLEWTISNTDRNNNVYSCSDQVQITISSCPTLDFDGDDDNVTFRNDFTLDSGPFSIEIWVKPDPEQNDGGVNNAVQTILSKRDESTLNTGYDLQLRGNRIYFNWNQFGSLVVPEQISTNRWYHVAVTFDGTNTYKIYIDGIELASTTSGARPTYNASDNFECIMGAMDRVAAGGNPTPLNYFSGWLDELRIWNVELSVNQIRHMMNQEIGDNGGNVRGRIIPIDIPGPPAALSWANLDGYYRMNSGEGDISNGYLLANAGTRDGQMRNITTTQLENSPLPYETDNVGNWYNTGSDATSPWLWGHSVWDYPNAIGIDGTTRIDWNIVRTSHNVDSDLTSANPRDLTVLGLLVNPTSELTITAQGTQDENNTGHGLFVTHYLRLDGQIDLVGESQLVQKRYTTTQVNGSILDVDSSGYLERDQQGAVSYYNYNYWAAPVGPRTVGSNNNPYTIDGILNDGTISSSPIEVSWVTGAVPNGDPLELNTNGVIGNGTTPIELNDYWQYVYVNRPADDYYQWEYVGPYGSVSPGSGFTLKGSGSGQTVYSPLVGLQNYTFSGKPHNELITSPIGVGNEAVVGNPYASAIDAHEFIDDNGPGRANSITGPLYFWDHYESNATHITELYEGGYATLTKLGAVPAVQHPDLIVVPNLDQITPSRYVPVGQGFFVGASASGGLVTFENDQRFFRREATGTSVFLKSGNAKGNNSPPPVEEDLIKRIRLDFTSPDNAIRQILLGFVPNNLATDDVDYGYDALNTEVLPNDISWMINDEKYLIQGVGDFDVTKQLALGIFLTTAGTIEISLNDMENFDTTTKVYIYDMLLGTYTRINNKNYEFNLDAGDYVNRFYLTFMNKSSLSIEDDILEENPVIINYLNDTDEIYIKTPNNIDVKQVYLINMLGQSVKSWNATNAPMSHEIKLPVKNVSSGNYIIKVETNTNSVNKKILIKH
jgi:hypothetical protein